MRYFSLSFMLLRHDHALGVPERVLDIALLASSSWAMRIPMISPGCTDLISPSPPFRFDVARGARRSGCLVSGIGEAAWSILNRGSTGWFFCCCCSAAGHVPHGLLSIRFLERRCHARRRK
jgi:hypothetical protein